MIMRHSVFAGVFASASAFSPLATAAILQPGDLLTITPGVPSYDADTGNYLGVTSGSWFGVDFNGNYAISSMEKTAMYPGTAGGLIVGQTQAAGEIDHSVFMGTDAQVHTVSAPVSGDGTLDLSGWRWLWDNGNSWTLGSGAWTPTNAGALGAPASGYADGVALFSWSGVYGDGYSLWYAATEPLNSQTGCGGCQFFWHLEGTVVAAPSAVPAPAAAWLFASGLLGLLGLRKRR